ncbi:MAG: Ig-like domain-containing protein [Clostridia bacterium]
MKRIRHLSAFMLLVAVLTLCLGGMASAAEAWQSGYAQFLKQNGRIKRSIALVDLWGDGEPELVSMAMNAKGVGTLSVARCAGGAVKQLRSSDSLFDFDAARFKGVSGISTQLRKDADGVLCLSIGIQQKSGGVRTTTRVAFVPDGASSLQAIYLASKSSKGGASKYTVGGKEASAAKYESAQQAFGERYVQAGGPIPSKSISRSDKPAAIQAKFDALASRFATSGTATGIRLSKTKLSLVVGHSFTLSVSVKPASAASDTVTFESSDESVATVGPKGKVTSVGAGRATITASTRSGKRATCAVTVTGAQSGAVSGVELDRTALSLSRGETYTLTATVQPVGATASLAWSSGNPSVATVREGKVVALSKGQAVITVKTRNGHIARCKVIVNTAPALIVDISSHNNKNAMDWEKISKSVSLLILRCGVTRTQTPPLGIGRDVNFPFYAEKCKQYGIPFGVYYYGKCSSVAQAKEEAQMTWSIASPYKPLFYVYDVEEARLTKEMIEAYMTTLQKLGAKKTGYYIAHHLYGAYDLDTALVDFIWLPHYGKNDGTVNSTPKYPCDIHQYSSQGRVPGFPGVVDVNRLMGGKTLGWFLGTN